MKITSIILCFSFLIASTQIILAQTNFKIKTLVNSGQKAKQKSSTLRFSNASFSATLRKKNLLLREFKYTDILSIDYSYSEKPLFSRTAIYAAALFISIFVVPFMFMKKKSHWLTVRTADNYLVMRLGGDYEQILNEFESRKIKIRYFDEQNSIFNN